MCDSSFLLSHCGLREEALLRWTEKERKENKENSTNTESLNTVEAVTHFLVPSPFSAVRLSLVFPSWGLRLSASAVGGRHSQLPASIPQEDEVHGGGRAGAGRLRRSTMLMVPSSKLWGSLLCPSVQVTASPFYTKQPLATTTCRKTPVISHNYTSQSETISAAANRSVETQTKLQLGRDKFRQKLTSPETLHNLYETWDLFLTAASLRLQGRRSQILKFYNSHVCLLEVQTIQTRTGKPNHAGHWECTSVSVLKDTATHVYASVFSFFLKHQFSSAEASWLSRKFHFKEKDMQDQPSVVSHT